MKWIERNRLEAGMYVVQYGSGDEGDPLVFVDRPVQTPEEIDELVPSFVDRVMIDETFDFEKWRSAGQTAGSAADRAEEETRAMEDMEAALEARMLAETRNRREFNARVKAWEEQRIRALHVYEERVDRAARATVQAMVDSEVKAVEKSTQHALEIYMKEAQIRSLYDSEDSMEAEEVHETMEVVIAAADAAIREAREQIRIETARKRRLQAAVNSLSANNSFISENMRLVVLSQGHVEVHVREERQKREERAEAEKERRRLREGAEQKFEESLRARRAMELLENTEQDQKRRKEEERRRQAEQEERRAQEEARRAEEETQRLEDERRAAEAKRRKAEEEQLRRRAEEARQREHAARKRAEEMARLKAELEDRRAAEAEQRKAEEAARRERLAAKRDAVLDDEDDLHVPIEEEIVRADRLYGDAVHYAREFLDNVRDGKAFDFREAIPTVDGFIDSIFRNEAAASALCKLRKYDEYTYTHSINVAVLSIILGKHIGLERNELQLLGLAGIFHDVGKALIPEAILNKPGKLTRREMDIMRTHPHKGHEILSQQKDIPEEVVNAALEHHERYDGKGYPRGLRGEDIHLISRIVGVVDVYDALTSKRAYKDPLPPGKVLGMMYKWRLSDFHPNIVDHFIKSLGIYPVGSFVRLTSGEYAVVVDHNPHAPLRPVVKIVFDYKMRPMPSVVVNLAATHPADGEEALLISDIVNPHEHRIDVAKLMR